MSEYPSNDPRTGSPPSAPAGLRRRLAELRGPGTAPRPLDARALAALAANPGCDRRALLDGAGIDKNALATALGAPSDAGQSQFAFMRGNAFEARVKADGGAELLRLTHALLGGGPEPTAASRHVPDLTARGPEARTERTAGALREAAGREAWTLLDHPMLALDVAGSPAYLEPDAVVVAPDGTWTVVEIKSFPMIDGAADPAKVGAAARQSAVYVLALEGLADGIAAARVCERVLLVCPRDFSNLPTAAPVDVRKQLSVTRRQLTRLTRVPDLLAALPEGTVLDPALPAGELREAVAAVPAAYAPECLSTCELAFHCRASARSRDEVTALGRAVRGELGGLATVGAVLAAAHGETGDPADPAVAALRRAHALRGEALRGADGGTGTEAGGAVGAPRARTAPDEAHAGEAA